MIVMCFEKHLIFGDDPLFPDGKDFGDVSRQNVIMIVYHFYSLIMPLIVRRG